MNCPYCECPECVEDRTREDLKAHRLKVLESWNWNCNARGAGKSLSRELAAGRGGDLEAWTREITAYFKPHTASSIIDQLA